MISEACLNAYRRLFPNDSIAYEEPGDLVFIEVDGKDYNQPFNETDATFMQRLSRCTPERNVFKEEWPENKTDYNDVWL